MRRPGEPKHRLSRRFGFDVFGTGGASLARRLSAPPGGIRRGRRRKQSTYGEQLTEKQKLKAVYGVAERQLRREYEAAILEPGNSGENLLSRLERRLDNVVYRLGFARSRPMARQLVGHGHVRVNGRRTTIPSFLVEAGQEVVLAPSAARLVVVEEALTEGRPVPEWLRRDDRPDAAGGVGGHVERLPTRADIELPVDERLVVGFYSR
jgi:small subunit ribosomal protein S4